MRERGEERGQEFIVIFCDKSMLVYVCLRIHKEWRLKNLPYERGTILFGKNLETELGLSEKNGRHRACSTINDAVTILAIVSQKQT